MTGWQQNTNGNYVYPMGDDGVMTVYRKNGEWRGIYKGSCTPGTYDTPEEAMIAMESAVLGGEQNRLEEMDSGWRESTKGGIYRRCILGILTVKRAASGKWYASITGRLIKNKWFDSAEDARRYLNQLVSDAIA